MRGHEGLLGGVVGGRKEREIRRLVEWVEKDESICDIRVDLTDFLRKRSENTHFAKSQSNVTNGLV